MHIKKKRLTICTMHIVLVSDSLFFLFIKNCSKKKADKYLNNVITCNFPLSPCSIHKTTCLVWNHCTVGSLQACVSWHIKAAALRGMWVWVQSAALSCKIRCKRLLIKWKHFRFCTKIANYIFIKKQFKMYF